MKMFRNLCVAIACAIVTSAALSAQPAVTVQPVQTPMIPGYNALARLDFPSADVDALTVRLSGLDPAAVEHLALYDGQQLVSDEVRPDKKGQATLHPLAPLSHPVHLYVKIADDAVLDLYRPLNFRVLSASIGSRAVKIGKEAASQHHTARVIRNFGDDGVHSYRIPGLVTSVKGTLVACFDIRHNNSRDLQGDIDVGVMRSEDGGRTWGPMIVAMDMGEYGGLGQELNGIGDPCILVDEVSGDLLLFAAWVHDNPGTAWWNAKDGFEIHRTPQLMMARSTDDGLSWSEPVNLTRQIKQEAWNFTFQGPGRGITMADGTLVVPFQHQEADRTPAAGIMYSKDGGENWSVHEYAKINTTENQVAEIAPGRLLLSIRDNRGGHRAMYVTEDLGRSWTPHASDGVLPDPVCMASLIHVNAADNVLKKDLTLFSNPASSKGRNHITIRASLDGGATWNDGVLLDQNEGWGYSCLTLVDPAHVGILYESSVGNMTFQIVALKDLVK